LCFVFLLFCYLACLATSQYTMFVNICYCFCWLWTSCFLYRTHCAQQTYMIMLVHGESTILSSRSATGPSICLCGRLLQTAVVVLLHLHSSVDDSWPSPSMFCSRC